MSFEMEKAVIGCLIMDVKSIEKVYLNLTEDKFSDPYLGRIYHEIRKSYDNGKGLDVNTLVFTLGDIPNIQPLLAECLDKVSTSVKIEEYAGYIVRDYKARMLDRLLNIHPTAEGIDGQIEELQAKLEILTNDRQENSQTAEELVNEFRPQRGIDTREQGIALGFAELDKKIGGLDGGDIAIIGARPAVGKTAFAVQVMMNIAKSGKKVELFSLEMTNEQIYDRIISHESGISLQRVKRALRFTDEELPKIDKANDTLKGLKDRIVFLDDVDSVTEMEVSLKKHKPDVAIVDYVQLIKPESQYRGNRYAEVGAVSHAIKKMAKKLKIPIILLCQLNRVFDETKEPSMNELRESGDLEQDASVVCLLWNETEDKIQKGVKVDKSRSGETGKITLYFEGRKMRFSETGTFSVETGDTPFA